MPIIVDSNILVYVSGADGDRTRQPTAVQALRDYRDEGSLAVQVLAEFANVLIHKHKPVEAVPNDINIQHWRKHGES